MQKYIHYCWFGGKPLSKLAKKCIKSWEKYLPDYQIIRWDESNCDVNECPFVKGAYENKKWAFVADYFRTKALKEYGGIYFDTDMEVTKTIDKLLIYNKSFLGLEELNYINAAVWYEKKPNGKLPSELLKIYTNMDFRADKSNEYSIPKLLTPLLKEYGLNANSKNIQKLEHEITIYPREYFYPLSMNRDTYVYTDNTCMVHYYDATWITKKQKLEMYLVRYLGRKATVRLEEIYSKIKKIILKCGYYCLYPLVLYRKSKRKKALITSEYLERLSNTKKIIQDYKDYDYIVFHNNEWLGVTSATKELFENLTDCGELYRKEDIELITKTIIDANIKQVVFSAFAVGWKDLVISIKNRNKNIKIKVYWHGSNSQVLDEYGWARHIEIIKLYKKGLIDAFATCKNSLIDFYKANNIDAMFITNKVDIPKYIKPHKSSKSKIKKIGLYAAKCTDWRKNMFTQMAALADMDNIELDMVPLSLEAEEFAKLLNIKISGVEHGLLREELLERMAKNDVNLYVSFSECSPMVPLESMELGVPCISGNNHHYFINSDLEEYVIVKNESNPFEIRDKIIKCCDNSKKIIELYHKFSLENKQQSKKDVEKFLER